MTPWLAQKLLQNKLLIALLVVVIVVSGLIVAPFDFNTNLPRSPVAVDALPNTGENQQIVFAEWAGRSPEDIENQVSYPLSVQLMGVPGVKDVRTLSMFGLSSVAVIFSENTEFYWARARLLEKLSSLPANTLPAGVQPALGPDATALGQVFQYTLQARDAQGQPIGGWDLDELRSVQEWLLRDQLLAAEGISEVASIGGFQREYQIDIDPEALRYFNVTLEQVMTAVQQSNLDISARTTEINQVEYIIRGIGFIKSLADIENTAVRVSEGQAPILVSHVATVGFGPGERRGILDLEGAEAVGGIVTVRYGYNPLQAIENIKQRLSEISGSLPARAVIDWSKASFESVQNFADTQQLPYLQSETLNFHDNTQRQWTEWLQNHPQHHWPEWLNLSQITVVPFYDRSTLITETLGTLSDALTQQLLITSVVVLLLLLHVRSAITVASMLPLAVLITFIGMRFFNIEANIVALAGIAIAIGTIVDMGIIITDNILRLREKYPALAIGAVIQRSLQEVGPAVATAIATTVISFLPVIAMTGAEGKLFTPLAYTKTLVLLASVFLALVVLPVILRVLLSDRLKALDPWLAARRKLYLLIYALLSGIALIVLSLLWEPLGPAAGPARNFIFVLLIFASVVGGFKLVTYFYEPILGWCLQFKAIFLLFPALVVLAGVLIFPQLDREFMPALDEGSFLLMPSTMPHASIGEIKDILSAQNKAISAIPEVDSVVGKAGRADTALDPAPLSMIETIINYKSEYKTDDSGRRLHFKVDKQGRFLRNSNDELIDDSTGKPFRQWREHIRTPQHIWQEVLQAAQLPGVTSAPRLQPIETRQIMLQTGMRAAMGVKVQAPDLAALESAVIEVERTLRDLKSVNGGSVNAERIAASPYLEIHLNRQQIARYGLSVEKVQATIASAIGGAEVTRTVEGRERYPVRVRYQRETRNDIEAIQNVLVSGPNGKPIRLSELTDIHIERGPQMIRSENTFLTGYVTFGPADGYSQLETVAAVQNHLDSARQTANLRLAAGVTYTLAGSFQQRQSAMQTLKLVIPLSLLLIFALLYRQFKKISVTLMVFSGIAVAWGGGFIALYLYGQPWFANFSIPWLTQELTLRDIFHIDGINLSIAVWVGFLALFGIAIDDGIVMATYLQQRFKNHPCTNIQAIREQVIEAGKQRIRPCLITTATTILALFPVLTSTGRGADLMVPMAIPTLGGMAFVIITILVVPVLYCWQQELKLHFAAEYE